MESMVPVCDKRYHIYNRFRLFWAEIRKLWNYPLNSYVKGHRYGTIPSRDLEHRVGVLVLYIWELPMTFITPGYCVSNKKPLWTIFFSPSTFVLFTKFIKLNFSADTFQNSDCLVLKASCKRIWSQALGRLS